MADDYSDRGRQRDRERQALDKQAIANADNPFLGVAEQARSRLAADNDAAIKAAQEKRAPQGPRPPTQFETADRVATVAEDHDRTASTMGGFLSDTKQITKKDKLHQPVLDRNEAVRWADSEEMKGKLAQNKVERHAAEQFHAQLVDDSRQIMSEHAATEAAQAVRAKKLQSEQDFVTNMKRAETEAIDRHAAAPPEDAGRYWSNLSFFRKAMYTLSAGLLGGAGMDPFANLDSAIQQDIEEQRGNRAQLMDDIGARGKALTGAQATYNQILETVKDERAADLVMQNIRWKEMAAKMQALQAELGAAAMGPQQQQLMAKMIARIADNELAMQKLAIAHPYQRTSTVPTISGPEREVKMAQFKHELNRAAATEDAAISQYGTAAADAPQPGAPMSVQERAENRQEREFQHKQKQDLLGGERGGHLAAGIGMIKDWQKEFATDIEGQTEMTLPVSNSGLASEFGRTVFGDPSRLKLDRDTRKLVVALVLNNVTGAVAAPIERQGIIDTLQDETLSGDQVRSGMASALRLLELQHQHRERASSDEAAADYRGVSPGELPPIEKRYGGRGARSADDETFGGRER